MADYRSPEDIREQNLVEVDMYDQLSPELSMAYQQRLQKAMDLTAKHLSPDIPQAQAIRHRLLNTSGLAGGETNYWANPYDYMHRGQEIKYLDPDLRNYYGLSMKSNPSLEGIVTSQNPYRMYLEPASVGRTSPAPRLLGHEGTHGFQHSLDNRLVQQMLRGQREGTLPKREQNLQWQPNFSKEFLTELQKEGVTPESPFYGHGFGSDPLETMAYFMGREAELRKGQTLLDDPVSRRLFSRYPGMYEEYEKSRNTLRNRK